MPSTPLQASIAVFAHNEERHIVAGLESLYRGGLDGPFRIQVLANGCTDQTAARVDAFAANHPEVLLCVIPLGDKANAWNHYIHDLAPEAAIHVFFDADVRCAEGALVALQKTLRDHPRATAAAGLPASGRSETRFREALLRSRGLAGNLYALRGGFVDRIRSAGIRLPIGFIGEDSLVGALVKYDLIPASGWCEDRVEPSPEARFQFASLDPLSIRDIRLYWRRRIRYSLRRWQMRMFIAHVTRDGFRDIPRDVAGLYAAHPETLDRIQWAGVDTIFSLLARRRILRALQGRRAAGPPSLAEREGS